METTRRFAPWYDVVIVGARSAGAATALLLARAGAKILLVDRQAYATDTLSTHAIMRAGVLQLHRWKVLPKVMAAGTPAIRKTVFQYGDEAVSIDIKAEHGVEYLCAPRRTVLDRILVDAARDAGADVQHGVALFDLQVNAANTVKGVCLKDASGQSTSIRAGIVIGADGRHSTVAGLLGSETYTAGSHASCCVFGYFDGIDLAGSHWHFAEGATAGVIPTNQAQHCVFVCLPHHMFRSTFAGSVERGFFEVLRNKFPPVAAIASPAELSGRLRGFAGAPGHLKRSHGAGWALVGDAGYFKDPLTAHGITDALRDAELLAQAIMSGRSNSLAAYQEERDALSRPLFEITDRLAAFDWSLEKAKVLHTQLSAAMRVENDRVAALTPTTAIAA